MCPSSSCPLPLNSDYHCSRHCSRLGEPVKFVQIKLFPKSKSIIPPIAALSEFKFYFPSLTVWSCRPVGPHWGIIWIFSCDYDKYRFIEPVHFLNLSFCSSKVFFEIKTWCNKTPNQSLYLFFAFTQAFNDRQSYNPYPSQPYINPKLGLSDSDRLEGLNGRAE